MRIVTAALILALVFSGVPSLFAQGSEFLAGKNEVPSYSKTLLLGRFFLDSSDPDMVKRWLNSQMAISRGDSREKLREQWEEFLGVDVFYPYFKAKEVEKFVQSRTRVDFFNFKGRAEFEEGSSSVRYIFKKKF